jgi:hypothetical protein
VLLSSPGPVRGRATNLGETSKLERTSGCQPLQGLARSVPFAIPTIAQGEGCNSDISATNESSNHRFAIVTHCAPQGRERIRSGTSGVPIFCTFFSKHGSLLYPGVSPLSRLDLLHTISVSCAERVMAVWRAPQLRVRRLRRLGNHFDVNGGLVAYPTVCYAARRRC